MRFIGNIIWFVVGGWWLAVMWIVFGLIAAVTIIGLPLTRASFEMAKLSAFPFGKDVVHVRELDQKDLSATTAMTGTIGFIVNILWACSAGLALFIGYLIAGVLACCTIIGIPFGLQSFKLAGLSFWPVGRRVVTKEMAEEARRRNAVKRLDAMQRA
jgi:uncharacterized membrane protein YccF (DUF307 family)